MYLYSKKLLLSHSDHFFVGNEDLHIIIQDIQRVRAIYNFVLTKGILSHQLHVPWS